MKLVELWRYPVKSMQGERLESAELTRKGIPGDRRWALRGTAVKPIVGPNASAKQYGRLLEASARLVDGEPVITLPKGEVELSSWLGADFVLHDEEGAHFDARPIHLVTTGSLSLGDVRRFRPNLVVEGEGELSWIGKRLQIGQALLRLVKPTERCVMITHPQPGLPRDPSLIKACGGVLGVYAEVERPGRAVTGSDVRLIDAP